jgi:hypothetical protein
VPTPGTQPGEAAQAKENVTTAGRWPPTLERGTYYKTPATTYGCGVAVLGAMGALGGDDFAYRRCHLRGELPDGARRAVACARKGQGTNLRAGGHAIADRLEDATALSNDRTECVSFVDEFLDPQPRRLLDLGKPSNLDSETPGNQENRLQTISS